MAKISMDACRFDSNSCHYIPIDSGVCANSLFGPVDSPQQTFKRSQEVDEIRLGCDNVYFYCILRMVLC